MRVTTVPVAKTGLARTRRGQTGPLSYTQEQLWLVEQLASSGNLYNECWAIRFRGRLDVGVLSWCLNEFVGRHEILRTVFPLVNGRPVQKVLPQVPLRLDAVDLTDLAAPMDAVIALAHEEVEQPYDHANGPLHRLRLLRLADGDHVLLIALHHMLGDGTSADIVIRELNALYPRRLAGESPALPALPLQYRDFALWQREAVDSGALADDAGYWERKLAGVAPLQLPSDRPRPTFKGEAGDRRLFDLGRELSGNLHAFARDHAVTPYMVMIAAFAGLLQCYAGSDDLLLGLASGRVDAELSELFGLFAQTIPIRLDLSGDPRFSDLLLSVRDTVLEALDHRYLPFEKVVELVRPERDPTRTPIVQVHFASRQLPTETFDLPGVEASWFEIPRSRSRFDLIVEVDTRPGLLEAWVEFDTQLFGQESISLLMRRYRRFVRAVIARPDLRVLEVPVMDDAERELLESWSDAAPQPGAPDVADLVEAGAARMPDGLLARAHAIARSLPQQPIGQPVCVCLPASSDAVAALLAVLQRNHPVLPVDPSLPAEQRIALLDRTATTAAVTAGNRLSFPGGGVVVVELENLKAEPAHPRASAPAPFPASPACIQPSLDDAGAVFVLPVDRASFSALVVGVAALFPPDARVLLTAPTDVLSSAFVLASAAAGASTHAPEDTALRSPKALERFLSTAGVTVAEIDPATLERLDPGRLPALATIFTRTRPSDAAVSRWSNRMLWLWHTEGGHPLGIERLERQDERRWAVLRPVPGISLLVTRDDALAPIGVPGDLGVRVGAAPSALNTARTTADRFRPDPSPSHSGALVLGTGRRARWTQAGELELIGQAGGGTADADRGSPRPSDLSAQVAIETIVAEIYADLLDAPAVGPESDFFALGGHSIVAVDAVERIRAELGVEVPVRAIFERSSVADIAAFIAEIEPKLGEALAQLELIGDTPFEEMLSDESARLEPAPLQSASPGPAAPQASQRRYEVAPLSSAQEQIWVVENLAPGTLKYALPYVLRVRGPFDVEALRTAFTTIVGRHDTLRASFEAINGQPRQRIWSAVPVQVPIVDRTGLEGEARERAAADLVAAEAARPFDLTQPPLIRLTVIQLAADDYVLVVDFHHLVNDLVSTELFFRDLTAAYAAAHSGHPFEPRAPGISYPDYIRFERGLLTGDSLSRLEAFWRDALVDVQPLVLPCDFDRPDGLAVSRTSLEHVTSRRLTDGVYRLARTERVTPFMIQLAIFAEVLARWSGQDDVIFGVPMDNRHGPGANDVMGCFTNAVPLRVRRDDGWTLRELLRHVRAQLLAAYRHQALPIARIARLAGAPMTGGRLPLVQVSCAMSPFHLHPIRFGSCAVDVDFAGRGEGAYELGLHSHSRVSGLLLKLTFDTGLWREASVEQLLATIERGLERATGGGDQHLSDLELDLGT